MKNGPNFNPLFDYLSSLILYIGSHLYAYCEEYADFIYPMACAIDTPLPFVEYKDIYHIMLNKDSKANWAIAPEPNPEKHAFSEYPDVSLEDWHKNNNRYV